MTIKPRPADAAGKSLTTESLWSAAVAKLRGEIPRPAFDTWLRDLEPLSFSSDTLTLAVANSYGRDWILEHYAHVIERALEAVVGAPVDLTIVCPESDTMPQEESAPTAPDASEDLAATIRSRYLSGYDEIVRPERVVAFPSYYLRWLPYLGVELAWLPIGFRQVGYLRGMEFEPGEKFKASGREIARWSGMSLRTFRRRVNDPLLRWFVKPTGSVRQGTSWTFAADNRPHQETAEWQVVMSMPLTPHDQDSLRGWLQTRLDQGMAPAKVLQLALQVPVAELLPPPDDLVPPETAGEPRSVQDVVKEGIGAQWAQSRKALGDLSNSLALQIAGPPILVSHYFIRKWVPLLGAGPAWLVALLRSRKPPTAGSKYEIEIAGGYEELAGLLGLSTNWTVARWLRKPTQAAAAIRRFIEETEGIRRPDNRVSRRFYVSDIEPRVENDLDREVLGDDAEQPVLQAPRALDTRGPDAPRAVGTRSFAPPRADGTTSREPSRVDDTRKGDPGRALGTRRESGPRAHDISAGQAPRAHDTGGRQAPRVGGRGLRGGGGGNPDQRLLEGDTTSSTYSFDAKDAEPTRDDRWDLDSLLLRARVNPRARAAANGASGAAFVSWMLYAASARGRSIIDPVGHAVSRLRSEPETGAGAMFDRLADLGPGGLVRLLADPATAPYVSRDWSQAMDGADQGRIRALREIVGDVEEEQEDGFWDEDEE
ncbi:MAG: DnaA N-terminal domain-containing protein [Chloroflexota bacterium]